jgi:Zn-finger nucleic acid-binding protein
MMSTRKCPHCGHLLQAFLVASPSGTEVELERCTQCGGFWSERGRIQDVFGPSARYELVGGMTQRRCILCRILMTPARLPSGIAVEVCSACRGMFLDRGELEQLGARRPARDRDHSGPPRSVGAPPAAAPPHAAPPPRPVAQMPEAPEPAPPEEARPVDTAGTFECVECGQRKPLREGQALREGLACRACMKARAEGRDSEDLSLRNLLFGRPKS